MKPMASGWCNAIRPLSRTDLKKAAIEVSLIPAGRKAFQRPGQVAAKRDESELACVRNQLDHHRRSSLQVNLVPQPVRQCALDDGQEIYMKAKTQWLRRRTWANNMASVEELRLSR